MSRERRCPIQIRRKGKEKMRAERDREKSGARFCWDRMWKPASRPQGCWVKPFPGGRWMNLHHFDSWVTESKVGEVRSLGTPWPHLGPPATDSACAGAAEKTLGNLSICLPGAQEEVRPSPVGRVDTISVLPWDLWSLVGHSEGRELEICGKSSIFSGSVVAVVFLVSVSPFAKHFH